MKPVKTLRQANLLLNGYRRNTMSLRSRYLRQQDINACLLAEMEYMQEQRHMDHPFSCAGERIGGVIDCPVASCVRYRTVVSKCEEGCEEAV